MMKLTMDKNRRRKLHWWLNDDFTDLADKLKFEPLIEAGYWMSEKLNRMVCAVFGHYVIDDQCGMPHHRYCAYCMKKTPNQPSSE